MICVKIVIFKLVMDFRCNEKQRRMLEQKTFGNEGNFLQRTIRAGRVRVALFLHSGVNNKVTDILDHLLVLEVQHAHFSQKETHIQEYKPCGKAEYPYDGLVSERLHVRKITLNF
jgi:hypothetical protein